MLKCLLITVTYPNMYYEYVRSSNEMIELAKACDLEVLGFVHQNLTSITPKSFIGPGKVDEIKLLLDDYDVVLFDDDLSPMQMNFLSEEWDITLYDRTNIILQIFASRAKSKEARLQVEIATYQYMLPRLVGMKSHLHGQLGGKNFRGSGEKQIDLDKRIIYNQLLLANKALKEMVNHRQIQRSKRKKNEVPVIALVGYTNSGKSTLLNQFIAQEEKKVFAKDLLFATLETSSRKIEIQGHDAIMVDTVGFIERLPHHLVKAFRATLEEVIEADVLIHVIDSNNEDHVRHIEVTNHVIDALGGSHIPMIYAYNKVDTLQYYTMEEFTPSVYLSAKEGTGLEQLQNEIRLILFKEYVRVMLYIPYDQGEVFQELTRSFSIIDTKYTEDCIEVFVEGLQYQLEKYLIFCKENL